jgi:hypothetical protein
MDGYERLEGVLLVPAAARTGQAIGDGLKLVRPESAEYDDWWEWMDANSVTPTGLSVGNPADHSGLSGRGGWLGGQIAFDGRSGPS